LNPDRASSKAHAGFFELTRKVETSDRSRVERSRNRRSFFLYLVFKEPTRCPKTEARA